MRKDQFIGVSLLVALTILVGVGIWKTSGKKKNLRVPVSLRCEAVMGTDCLLMAVVEESAQGPRADKILHTVETTLRDVEAKMSSWIDASEIGGLNRKPAAVEIDDLSPETLEVLRLAKEAYEETGGAFDVTCRPVVQLWRKAAEENELPSPEALAEAKTRSNWDLLEIEDDHVFKKSDAVQVDLGGIAKGYAIDKAIALMQQECIEGGVVNVGGDLRCFGKPERGDLWPVIVKNPAGEEPLAELEISAGAVCTSGNYERFNTIEGKRYSHIVDPRTGQPADAVFSVTVVAPTAVEADIWATALSVLGPKGIQRLPEGIEAMMFGGDANAPERYYSDGFEKLLKERAED